MLEFSWDSLSGLEKYIYLFGNTISFICLFFSWSCLSWRQIPYLGNQFNHLYREYLNKRIDFCCNNIKGGTKGIMNLTNTQILVHFMHLNENIKTND